MKRSRYTLFLVLTILALVLVPIAAAIHQARAENTTTAFNMAGVGGVKLTLVGATAGDVVSTPAQRGSKIAQVVRFAAGGQKMFVLVRVEKSGNGLWIDGIAAATTSALATAIAGFDISTEAVGHPHPVNDAVDDAASAGMAGYADP